MAEDVILTKSNNLSTLSEDRSEVTGTTAGTKRALDTATISSNSIDSANSTTVPLTNSSSFTGEWTERTHPEIIMAGASDQNFTFQAEFSVDGTNIDSTISYDYTAGAINVPKRLIVARKFFRIIVTNNSGSDMTFLRFQTSIGDFAPLASRLNSSLDLDADAEIVRSIQTGLTPDNEYENLRRSGRDSNNSTSTTLSASGVWRGIWREWSEEGYVALSLSVSSDVSGTLMIDFSTNNAPSNGNESDVTGSITLAYNPSINPVLSRITPIESRWVRLRYINGSTNQTAFVVSNTFLTSDPPSVMQQIGAAPTADNVASLTKSVLVAQETKNNTFINVGANEAGALNVSDFLFGVTRGRYPGFTIDTRFGYNPDIDTATDPEDIWALGGLYTGQPVHSAAAEAVNIVSSSVLDTSAGTGARTVIIFGLDSNFVEQSETLTLNGIVPVVSTLTYKRVFRANVLTAGATGVNQGTLTIRHNVTVANIFAQIPIGVNNTVLGAFTIPNAKTGYLLRLRMSIARASGAAGSATVSLRTREEGSVYQSKRYETISTSYPLDIDLRGGIVLQPRTDILLRIESVSDNNTQAAGAFEYLLVDN